MRLKIPRPQGLCGFDSRPPHMVPKATSSGWLLLALWSGRLGDGFGAGFLGNPPLSLFVLEADHDVFVSEHDGDYIL